MECLLTKGDYDIELVFLGHFSVLQKSVLQYTARRWMAVITEDLPDQVSQGWSGRCGDESYEIRSGERIDDLRIYVGTTDRAGISGLGGPHVLRDETDLPVVGCMTFNLASANLLYTGLHEIGHVLGFGTIWGGFLQALDGDTHFNGPLAIAAFDEAGGWDYTGEKVPVQKWDGSHWRSGVLSRDLMQPGGGPDLSAITVQSFADLGYGVDVTQADSLTLSGVASAKPGAKIVAALPSIPGVDGPQPGTYALPGAEPHWQGSIAGGLSLPPLRGRSEIPRWIGNRGLDPRSDGLMGGPSCGAGLMQEPIHVVDPQGRIVRTLGE